MAAPDRWPPVYDTETLAEQIEQLAGSPAIAKGFYDDHPRDVPLCQGDVLRLASDIPVLDEAGDPAKVTGDGLWLTIGNTCDIARTVKDAAWTQLVPVEDLGVAIEDARLAGLCRYSQTRRFYLPPWDANGPHVLADLTRPIALHKSALTRVTRLARLSYRSWVLLHSCLVRFLARDDGRYD